VQNDRGGGSEITQPPPVPVDRYFNVPLTLRCKFTDRVPHFKFPSAGLLHSQQNLLSLMN